MGRRIKSMPRVWRNVVADLTDIPTTLAHYAAYRPYISNIRRVREFASCIVRGTNRLAHLHIVEDL